MQTKGNRQQFLEIVLIKADYKLEISPTNSLSSQIHTEKFSAAKQNFATFLILPFFCGSSPKTATIPTILTGEYVNVLK